MHILKKYAEGNNESFMIKNFLNIKCLNQRFKINFSGTELEKIKEVIQNDVTSASPFYG